jgi:hypothetical protein
MRSLRARPTASRPAPATAAVDSCRPANEIGRPPSLVLGVTTSWPFPELDRCLLYLGIGFMRRVLFTLGLLLVAHTWAGCVTPSIPIPPPDAALMTFTVTGDVGNTFATFAYPPDINYENTVVFIYNRDRGLGIIEDAHPDGSVGPTAPVRAALGEQMVVSFKRDDQTVSTCVRLRDGAQSSTDYCDQ